MLCIVLYCYVLWCIVMYCYVLYVLSCIYAVFCLVMYRYVLLCICMYCYVLLCSLSWCYGMYCYVLWCDVMSCCVLSCCVLWCYVVYVWMYVYMLYMAIVFHPCGSQPSSKSPRPGTRKPQFQWPKMKKGWPSCITTTLKPWNLDFHKKCSEMQVWGLAILNNVQISQGHYWRRYLVLRWETWNDFREKSQGTHGFGPPILDALSFRFMQILGEWKYTKIWSTQINIKLPWNFREVKFRKKSLKKYQHKIWK